MYVSKAFQFNSKRMAKKIRWCFSVVMEDISRARKQTSTAYNDLMVTVEANERGGEPNRDRKHISISGLFGSYEVKLMQSGWAIIGKEQIVHVSTEEVGSLNF